ncbi:hypothetical protein V6N13_084028 [Hibiscus sabdariffa]|uniref:Acyl-[acyl-carrier-protein] hydrolase n=1 Tax=Hibiscus sabdariffa TaxID=183260 RepID=A0ABR2T038_9ROSI
MVAFRAEPTFPMLPSSFSSNRPKLRSGGNIKSLHVGVKYPKSTKCINMGVRKPEPDMIHDILGGRMVDEDLVFQQELMVRSSDIDSDSKLSIIALSNYLQDTLLNHAESVGMLSGGFATPEMSRRDLAWVTYKMGIAIDCYPCCLCTMMNMKTRKLSWFIEEAREELKPYLMPKSSPLIDNTRKLQAIDIDTIDFTSPNLSPGWNDLDVNQHVNNVKYVEWILEGAPSSIKKSHGLSGVDMEFRKECDSNATLKCLSKIVGNGNNEGSIEVEHSLRLDSGQEGAPSSIKKSHGLSRVDMKFRKECNSDSILKCLSKMDENYISKSHNSANGNNNGSVEVEHSLRLDNGQEVARGRTLWNPKHA